MVGASMVLPSRRERIKQLLRECRNPVSAEDIAALLGERTDLKSVYEDLHHVAKTVYGESRGKEYVIMIPPTCRVCNFIFKKLEKPKVPGRCPKCKSERITSPLFKIEEN
jgi:predicted Zn-ribbon and HTH transcriptional regulator